MRRATTWPATWPAATLLPAALALAALGVRLAPPALAERLIFDRVAVVDGGERWRIVTGALVHFSWSHALGDALALAAAGLCLDPRRRGETAALLVGAMAASGLGVLRYAPELRWYGGLSGVAHAVVVYASLAGLRRGGAGRALPAAVLGLVAVKLAVDGDAARQLAATYAGSRVVVADVSHRAAVAFALALSGLVALAGYVRAKTGSGAVGRARALAFRRHRDRTAERVGRPAVTHAGGPMHPVRIIVAIAAATVMLGAAGWSQRQPSPSPRVTESARAAHARREVVRLRAHFDSVDAELRARDVSRLTPAQHAARLELIAWLRDYRNAGRFPANDEPGAAPVPIFRDAHGTLCAMAYLVDRSGRGDIVDRVASTRNTAYVRQLVDDTALVAWLDANGLTAAEAGRIQPQYGGPEPQPSPTVDDDHVRTGYALTSLALGGASLATGGVNVVAPNRTGGLLGVLAGTAALVTGATRLDDDGGTHKLAVANTAVGAATIVLGLRAYMASYLAPRTSHSLRAASADRPRRATITPALLSTGGPGDTQRLGMLVHATF